MKINKFSTGCLLWKAKSPQVMESDLIGIFKIGSLFIFNDGSKKMEISWKLSFKNKQEEIVYNELSLTRFNYFSLGDIEKDFKDMEYFLANSIADIQQNLLIRHENLLFPEYDLSAITCYVLEKIILDENYI